MAINMVITDVGIAEITNAEASGTAPVILKNIGLGTGKYAPVSTQTAMKGQFKTIVSEFGGKKDDKTILITMRDNSADAYDVYEIGIYTDKGTLFAVYSQETPIISKSATSEALLAFNFSISNINPEYIELAPAVFDVSESATESRQGIAEIATESEAKAGTDDSRFITPKKLDAVIEGHDNIVHRSGSETIEGKKSFKSTIYKVSSQIDREITPSANIWDAAFVVYDKNSKTFFNLQAVQDTAGQNQVRMLVFDKEGSENQIISLGINSSGSPYATAPTPAAGDNSTKIATTAWVNTKAKEYLPLYGGIVTGSVYFADSANIKSSTDDYIMIMAGDNHEISPHILLRGVDAEQTDDEIPGEFFVIANNGTDIARMVGRPDGSLTWMKKNIVRSVNNINADAAGNVNLTLNYLPLAGGTLTGTISKYGGTFLNNTNSESSLVLTGDKLSHNASVLMLFGLEHPDFPGGFIVRAGNNTNSYTLLGKADGSLIWGGKNIVRSVNGVNANAAGNVTLNCLPLSGGQMTSTKAMSRDVANSFLGLHGGTGVDNDGAQLYLCGASHPDMPGMFQLHARNSNKVVTLQGDLDGKLTWNDKYVLNNSFLMPTDGGAIHLTAGTSATGGAYFRLYGKDHTSGAGQFSIAATDGTNTKALNGKPDGTLTWNGKDITLGYPNYAAGTYLGQLSSYTVTEEDGNGWINIYLHGRDHNKFWVYVNNILIGAEGGEEFQTGLTFIPVKVGDVIKTADTSNPELIEDYLYTTYYQFFPNR